VITDRTAYDVRYYR